MSHLARSVELKLTRAGSQIQALCREISEWIVGKPILVDVELREELHGFRVVHRGYSVEPPLEQWGLALGECIHNLRSALDNLAYALARVENDPPVKPKLIAFPVYQDRAQFESKGIKAINQLPQAAMFIIEQLQPFQRSNRLDEGMPHNDPLVLLQHLSNTDKHQVPPVVALSTTQWAFNMGVEFKSDTDAAANTPPDLFLSDAPLSPSQVLFEWKTNSPISRVTGTTEVTVAVMIPGPNGFEDIGRALTGLHGYIELVAAQFQDFFAATS